MIAKGTTHNNGVRLARYMTEAGLDNERAELHQLKGFAEDNVVSAFRTIQSIAAGTHCDRPFFHCQVRTPHGENLDRDQWEHVADRIGRMLGLAEQPRAIAFHMKDGHEHMHVTWSRIDESTMTAIPLPFFKLRLKTICRELEAELGLTAVRNERLPDEPRPLTRNEYEQAARLGNDAQSIRSGIREAWDRSDGSQAFVAALAEEGLMLARGDRRDYVVIDREGGMHALGKRILGMSAADIRMRLAEIDRESLPTIAEARFQQQEADPTIARDAIDPPSHEKDNPARNATQERADRRDHKAVMSGLRQAAGADAAKLRAQENDEFWQGVEQRRDAAAEQRMDRWREKAEAERTRSSSTAPMDPTPAALRVADAATGVTVKLLDFVANLLTFGAAEAAPEKPKPDVVEQIIERRRAAHALDQLQKQLQRGDSLGASEICKLTRGQLETLRQHGDDGMRRLIEQYERDRERERDEGRTRER